MTSRPWPDFRPGLLGSVAAWWRRRREFPDFATPGAAAADQFTFAPQPSSRQEQVATPLPSAVYGLDFAATFTVHWRVDLSTGRRHNAPRSAAINGIVQRARMVTGSAMLVHHVPLQHQLGDELSEERQVGDTHVWARAENIEIAVDPVDLDLARKRMELLRTKTNREAERESERAELRYLREEILVDLGTATVWWLHRNGYQVEQAVAVSTHLAELVRIATHRDDRHWADSLVTAFESAIPRLPDAHRADLRRHLAKSLGVYGGPELAAEFARHVELPRAADHHRAELDQGHP
ncbi:hypothetical protein F0L68_36995 [Solihabitans fulvus]|uniref:Uncharacterized protein n=1 Tax=Solihabitans fulvus TaxID=1892852 RepID=A0A5B2WMH8_9PSEU|nr:hypothetical protein [Solihabitans fulvus]KAA2252148.1 hypothetical protein F0L68_36995 [Solihabitans fulvus]